MRRFEDAELAFYTRTLPNLVGSWFGGWDRKEEKTQMNDAILSAAHKLGYTHAENGTVLHGASKIADTLQAAGHDITNVTPSSIAEAYMNGVQEYDDDFEPQ